MAPSFTVDLPEDLQEEMEAHSDVDWEDVISLAVRRHLHALTVAEGLLQREDELRVADVASMLEEGMGAQLPEAPAYRQRRE